MFKDRTIIWVLEYIFGAALVMLPLLGVYFGGQKLPEAHVWAVELFIICLGVVLISCASSMRQRISLGKKIERLAEKIAQQQAS